MSKKSRAGSIVEFNDGKLWFQKKNNILTLGITLDALDEIGECESISLPGSGDDFDKDDIVCEIIGTDGKIKVVTPAAGFVAEINESLSDDVQILSEDPIDEGWLVKLEVQDETDLEEYL